MLIVRKYEMLLVTSVCSISVEIFENYALLHNLCAILEKFDRLFIKLIYFIIIIIKII